MDLADQIDDYICSFEGIGDLAMDSLAMFIFIWAVSVLFLIWLCKFIYNKYIIKSDSSKITTTTTIATVNSTAALASGAKLNSNSLLNGSNKLDDNIRRSEPRELGKDVKISQKMVSGAPPRVGRSSYVAPETPVRKRIVRQSPGPEMRRKRTIMPPSNVVGPETTSVTWTSQVFRWLYSDLVIVQELLGTWVQALNENLRKSNDKYGIGVEIVRVLPDSPPPSLSNLFCMAEESYPADMEITFDCDAQPIIQIKAFRLKNGKTDISHYKVTISRFRARLQAAMSYNTLKGTMRIDGYPDIRITMNSVGAIKPIDQEEKQLQDTIGEILTHNIKDTTYPVDFSIYVTCPRSEIEHHEIPFGMENSNNLYGHDYSNGNATGVGKRLLVKILKGEGLASNDGAYVVVEMDEPPQKNQTGGRQGSNPYWDEHFLFDLSSQSAELLFEVYESPIAATNPSKFLGLGLVGIDELSVGPTSSQILALQPRPYETQKVQGAITVEFVFIDGATIPTGPRPYKLKEALRISTPNNRDNNVADAALKAIQEGAITTHSNPSKSTLIIHSIQRSRSPSKIPSNKDDQIEMNESDIPTDRFVQADLSDIASPNDSNAQLRAGDLQLLNSTTISQQQQQNEVGNENDMATENGQFGGQNVSRFNGLHDPAITSNSISQRLPQGSPNVGEMGEQQQSMENDRGRANKKRDFFGTLRKRLGKSKTRSLSADRDMMIPIDYGKPLSESRSASMGRGVGNVSSAVVSPLDHSRRSSISESSAISGFSSASNKTYVHESSALVLETIENGIKRHFLVPFAIAQKPRWRRKGTKLHIYNDHTFVAKHLSGTGLNCSICTKSIPRRPGKQGYECRDCQLICHKQCHIRAPQSCPNPSILSMELTKLNLAAADQTIRKL